MQTIKDKVISELVINKSKFITILIRVDDVHSVKDLISDLKEEYDGATHYCYAYVIGNNHKSSDDGEPSGTAGAPILSVLNKEHLSNVLCMVIRYYGGVKLGAPGLIRAYTKAITTALEVASKGNLVNGLEIVITFSYSNVNAIDYLLKNAQIKTSSFVEDVTYTFYISFDEYQKIKDELLMFVNTIYEKEKVFILI